MRTALIVCAALGAASCATVIRGTKETAKFESIPSGAEVTVESISTDKLGPFSCITPCEMELKRKRDWAVVFVKDGYKPVESVLEKKVTGGGVASGAGNVIAGGIIGIGVDAGTGANLDLRPNPMIAELAALDSDGVSRVLDDPEADKYSDPDEDEDDGEEEETVAADDAE
ncbi:MAG: translation initiation factor 2 [Hyphococcus sp.]